MKGAFRVDANVSVRTTDGVVIGPKVEVKNMNSFRSVERALEYEVKRQRAAVESGEPLVQETRGWLEDRQITVSQRTKEYAEDYRYFPEPDLPPLVVDSEWVTSIEGSMAELPAVRLERFLDDYALLRSDAVILTDEPDVADYFEEVVRLADGNAAEAAKWVMGEVFALARTRGGIGEAGVAPEIVAELIKLVDEDVITLRTAKEVFTESVESGESPTSIVNSRGLAQVSDSGLIADVAREVLDENPAAVDDYRAGKRQVLGFLIGQSMRKLRGAGNPDVVRTELTRILDED